MRRVLPLLTALVGVTGLCAVPAAAAPTPRASTAVFQSASTFSTSSSSLTVMWTNPHIPGFRSTIVRYASGTTAPRTASSGHLAGHPGRHTRTLRLTRLAAGHRYAFALFPVLTHHRYGPRLAVVGLVAPAAPTGALPFVSPSGMKVTWTNPKSSTFRRVVVRYEAGSAAPSAPTHGHGVALSSSRPSSAVVPHLLTNSHYSVSVFALDYRGGWSTPAVVRFTTPPAAQHAGTYSGTVTDAAHTPLVGAVVDAVEPATGTERQAVTGADGAFALPLASGEYWVSIGGQDISGGAAAANGYFPDFEDVVVHPDRTTTAHIVLDPGVAVHGRFTDDAGHPLAGVTPTLSPVSPYVDTTSDDGGDGVLISFASGGAATGDPSGPDGSFVIRGVDPSSAFRLCADTSGTVTGGSSDVTGYAARCADRTGVASATPLPDLALSPASGTTITGTVTGAHVDVPGAFVFLNTQDDSVPLFTRTDAHGRYALRDVPQGTAQVCASSPFVSAHAPTGLQDNCTGFVTVGSSPLVLDVALAAGAALTGTVRGPGGHRVAGADVEAQDADEDGTDTSTQAQGQYTVTGLPTGSYSLCVTPPSTPTSLLPTGVQPGCVAAGRAVHATAGIDRTGLDVTLPAGSAIRGTVTGAQGLPANAFVEVDAADPDNDFPGADAFTDAQGHYVVAGLPASTYRVCFQAVAVDTGRTRCLAHTVTTRLGHTVTHVDATMPPPTGVQVTVADTNGAAVAAADVTVLSNCSGGDSCVVLPGYSSSAKVTVDASFTTDAAGQAVLTGLAPGTYAVCAFGYDATTASGGSPTGYADTCTGMSYTVTSGHVQDASIVLPPGGAVSGTVTGEAAAPLAAVHAVVSNSAETDVETPDLPLFGLGPDSPLAGGNSGADGIYTVIGVRPGAQTVCFRAEGATGGSSPAGYQDQCLGAAAGSTSGGTPVTVTAGATTGGVDITLSPAGGISGRIKHGSAPLADGSAIAIVFSGHDMRSEVDEVATDASGRFLITGLAPSGYTVCFDSEDFGGQCWRNVAWNDDIAPPLARATGITVAAGAVVTGIDADIR